MKTPAGRGQAHGKRRGQGNALETREATPVPAPASAVPAPLLLLFLALAGPAFSQEPPPEKESPAKVALSYLKKYDANDDGHISKSEYSNAEFWKKYDGDGDGQVTALEIRQTEDGLRRKKEAMAPKRKESFRGLDDFGEHDADADGRFNRDELASFVHDSADQNRDGFLSEEELKYVDTRPGADEKQVDLDSFEKMDADKDKRLSFGEFELPPAYLDAVDRNNDRFASKEEMIEAILRQWGGVPGLTADAVLRKMDANGDLQLDRKEFDGKDRLWDQINGYKDMKEDPYLAKDEIERYIERVRELRAKANSFMTRYDFNGDGKVTRDEFDGSDGAFARCDTNGDGLITRNDGVE
jgi:Ca2+-binding EF-hand superfamily protein